MDMIFSGILSLDNVDTSSSYRHTTHSRRRHDYSNGARTNYPTSNQAPYPRQEPYRSGKPPASWQTETTSKDKGRRGNSGSGSSRNPPVGGSGGSSNKPPSSSATESVSRDKGRRK